MAEIVLPGLVGGEISVNQGNTQALNIRGQIGKHLSLAELNEAEAKARDWEPATP